MLRLLCLVSLCGGAAVADAQRPTPRVGPNVQVSLARSKDQHNEVVLAADPSNPHALLACAMLQAGANGSMKAAAYVSSDGGATWAAPGATLTTSFWANDPTCAFGPAGAAYVVHKASDGGRPARGVRSDADRLVVHHSADRGATWDAPIVGPQANDRPFIAVDTRSAQWRGRLYVAYNGHLHGESGAHDNGSFRNTVVLQASRDGGETWITHAEIGLMDQSATHIVNAAMAGAAVLSDGTALALYGHMIMGDPQVGVGKLTELEDTLMLARSTDGGASFEPPVRIAAIRSAYNWPSSRGTPASLAVDPGSPRFNDRVYVAWADYGRGYGRILVSHSSDGGRHWSAPSVASDDSLSANAAAGAGPREFMATLAVNRDGIVGVQWYDRRGVAGDDYVPRIAMSADGGETWTPSIAVSTAANARGAQRDPAGFFVNGGDTAGLAATADGVFHALWIDNRTGVQQVWTAPITFIP